MKSCRSLRGVAGLTLLRPFAWVFAFCLVATMATNAGATEVIINETTTSGVQIAPASGDQYILRVADDQVFTIKDVFAGNANAGAVNVPSTRGFNVIPLGPKGNGKVVILGSGARNGGGIFFQTFATSTLNNIRFGDIYTEGSGNYAMYGGNGGAIYAQTGTLFISNAEFYRNYASRASTDTAGGNGGAIIMQTSANLYATDVQFGSAADVNSGNKAINGSGGAMYLLNGIDVTLTNASFYYNNAGYVTVAGMGGAIYDRGANTTITSATFFGNSATTANTAAGATGGAIYHEAGRMILNDVVFTNNYAQRLGGAIINSAGVITLNVSKNLTYTGNYAGATPTAASGGFLMLSGTSALMNINVATGATLTLGSAGNAAYDTIASSVSSATLALNSGGAEYGGTLLLHADSGAFTSIFEVHGGRVILGNTNAKFGGQTKIFTGGTFGGIGTATKNITVNNGGAIQVGLDGGAGNEALAVSGTLSMEGGSKIVGSGSLRGATITIGAAAGDFVGVETKASSTITVATALGGSGGLAKRGDGRLQLETANTFAGGVRLEGGSIGFSNAGALGGGTLDVTGSGGVIFGSAMTFANAVTISGSAAFDTHGGDVTMSGAVSGAGALEKAGANKLTLDNASGLTGAVTISQGVLAGSINNARAVSIARGALYDGSLARTTGQTLAGSGTISGALSVTGGSLVLNLHESDGTPAHLYDQLSILGAATSGAGSKIDISNIGTAESYTILTSADLSGFDTSHFSFLVNGAAETNRTSASISKSGNDLILKTGVRNLRLTWAGGDVSSPMLWDAYTKNWSETSGEKQFRMGDSVLFNATVSGTVQVAATGVTVADMTVNTADGVTQVYAGGGITASSAMSDSDGYVTGNDGKVYINSTTTEAATSKLVKTGAGTLTFANAANNFTAGIDLQQGAISFSNGAQLGDGGNGIRFTGDATLRADATTTLSNKLSIAAGKTATVDTQASTLTLSGSISTADNAASLVKIGSGDLLVSATSTGHTGSTNVREGRFFLTGNGDLGTGLVTIQQAATFGGNGKAQSVTALAGSILQVGGPAAVTLEQLNIASTLTLHAGSQINYVINSGNTTDWNLSVNSRLNTGGITFTGGAVGDVTINLSRLISGIYNLGNVTSLAGAHLTYDGQELNPQRQLLNYDTTSTPGSLLLNVVLTPNVTNIWTGSVNGAWNINAQNWKQTDGSAYTFGDGDRIVFDSIADAATPQNRTITIAGTRMTISEMVVSGTGNYTFQGGAEILADANSTTDISGVQGKLTKSGAGTLSFENAGNTFMDGIEIKGGAVSFTKAAQLNTTGTSGIDAGITFSDSGTLRAAADAMAIFNKITIAAGKSGAIDTNGHTLTYAGTFDAASTGNFVKTGSGALVLTADNSAYAGTMSVEKGSLLLRDAAALIAGPVTVLNGGAFGGAGSALGAIDVKQGGALQVGASAIGNETLTISNATMEGGSYITGAGTLLGNLTIGASAADIITLSNVADSMITLSATTGGAGTLAKTGAGTLTLSGTSAFGHAATRIDAGVVYFSNIDYADIATLSHAFVLNGGWLDLSDVAKDTDDSPLNKWDNLTFTGNAGGVIGHDDQITLTGGVANFQIGGTTSEEHGVFVVIKAGPTGSVTMTGANTYAGYTRVDEGTLRINADANLGDTTLRRNVVLNGGNVEVTGSFTTARQIEMRNTGTFFVDGGVETTWSAVTGSAAMTKDGQGTLALSSTAAMTYTGTMQVRGGTLKSGVAQLAGTILNSATVAINQDAAKQAAVFTGTIRGGTVSKVGEGVVNVRGELAADIVNIERGTLAQVDALPLTFGASLNVAANGIFSSPQGGTVNVPLVRNTGIVQAGLASGEANGATLTINGNYEGTGIVYLGLGAVETSGDVAKADYFVVTGSVGGATRVLFKQADKTTGLANLAESLPTNLISVQGGGAGTFIQDNRVTFGVKDYTLVYDPATGTSHWMISMTSEIPALMGIDAAVMLSNQASYDALTKRLDMMNLADGYVGRKGLDVWANGIYRRSTITDTLYDGTTSDTYGTQVGIDYTDASKNVALGLFYDHIVSDADMPDDTSTKSTTDGFGAYITYRPGTWYFNVLLRTSSGTYDINIPKTPTLTTKSGGFGISSEVGWQIRTPSGVHVEPQVQLAWTRNNVDNVKDIYKREYRVEGIQSFTGRAGMLITKLHTIRKTMQLRPYARISYTHEFDGSTNMTVRTIGELIRYNNDLGGGYGTLNGGAALRLHDRVDVWADVAWHFAGRIEGYSFNIGAGYRF